MPTNTDRGDHDHDPNTVKAAQLLLRQLGVTLEDLRWTPVAVPTIAEYLPTVIAAAGPGARRTYGTYWTRIQAAFGDRGLDQITVTEIEALLRHTMASPLARRNSMGGSSAGENLIAALRAIYTRAIADQLLPPHHNPAAHVPKPRRRPSTRRALTGAELTAINDVVTTTGNDVPLETLLIRLHIETACRHGAAIRLQGHDLDERWSLLRLREKNGIVRWHPVSPTLTRALAAHQRHRATGNPTEALLRYRDGTPITARRYDHL